MPPKVALCVPTNRPEGLDRFLAAWKPHQFWTDGFLIVCQDARPERRVCRLHHDRADIEATLGADAWIISKGDSARRCYGFLLAYRMGADVIVTLDDDCMPVPGQDYLTGHMAAFERTPRWVSTVKSLTPRGMPYFDRGIVDGVKVSVGLWTNIPDLDAPHQLVDPVERFLPGPGSRIIPRGQYAPICGMNLAFRREATPLLYFPLMGEGQPYSRFDDIWAGVIAKRICDHLGWLVSVGEPHVRHEKASDPMTNLVKEAPGIAANESFWRHVDAIPLTASTAFGCVREMAAGLQANPDAYVEQLGRALIVWANLLEG